MNLYYNLSSYIIERWAPHIAVSAGVCDLGLLTGYEFQSAARAARDQNHDLWMFYGCFMDIYGCFQDIHGYLRMFMVYRNMAQLGRYLQFSLGLYTLCTNKHHWGAPVCQTHVASQKDQCSASPHYPTFNLGMVYDSLYLALAIFLFLRSWVNYDISITWIVGPFGDHFPYLPSYCGSLWRFPMALFDSWLSPKHGTQHSGGPLLYPPHPSTCWTSRAPPNVLKTLNV